MNVRFAPGSLRLRLDPRDLASLLAGAAAEVSISAPDEKGEMRAIRCTLTMIDSGGASVILDAYTISVRIPRAEAAELRRDGEEAVAFIQPMPAGGGELVVNIEKDRREFGRGLGLVRRTDRR